MYKIINGHAEIYVDYGTKQESLLKILGPQECFGEFGLLIHKPSIYTVVAYSEILLLKISEETFEEFIHNNHRVVADIMRNMANTMLTLRFQIGLLLDELESGRKPNDSTINNAKNLMRKYSIYSSIDEAVNKMKQ